MPELPDITVYLEALSARILGARLERIRLASPFLLRSVSPPLREAEGKEVAFYSSGKRAQSTLRFRRLPLAHSWTGFSDRPAYPDAQTVAHALADAFGQAAGLRRVEAQLHRGRDLVDVLPAWPGRADKRLRQVLCTDDRLARNDDVVSTHARSDDARRAKRKGRT